MFCPLVCFSLNTLIYVMGLSKIFLPVICALGYLYAINSLKYEKIASVWTRTTETDGPTANTFGLLKHRISTLRNCYITHKMYSAAVQSRWNGRNWQLQMTEWCPIYSTHSICTHRCIFHLRKVITVLSPCISCPIVQVHSLTPRYTQCHPPKCKVGLTCSIGCTWKGKQIE